MTEQGPSGLRKFRFGAAGEGNRTEGGARKFVQLAQQAEQLGYDTFVIPDQLGEQVSPFAALGALAVSTERIRLGTSVLSNGLRHPVLVAKEAATIDVLSRGRLELGIGAGWLKDDYDKAGIEFGSGAERVERLEESLQILDVLLRGQECNFEGKYYQVRGIKGSPRPRQGPRPPIGVGGGGPRLLRVAAKYADGISNVPSATEAGKLALSGITMGKTLERVDIIREAAGDRFDDIELNWTIAMIVITDDREQVADMAVKAMTSGYPPPQIDIDCELTKQDILDSPYVAIGTFAEIAEQIRAIRKQTSMSYVGVLPTQMEAFAPIIELLRGE